ncbi:MAG TPA: universal stress protein [Candidatus Limnocylindria bacterium]|nr:universal stress protein [Candidatus Limnocylindria bacterium]
MRKLSNEAVGFHRVVVPLDGTAAAEEMLAQLGRVARRTAQVTLVRAVPSAGQLLARAPNPADAPSAGIVDLVRLSEDGRREAQEYLGRLATDLRRRGYEVRITVDFEPAADAILRAADQLDADLIAMTTHARAGLERVLFGSVADAVLRGSTRPVFLERLRGIEDHDVSSIRQR